MNICFTKSILFITVGFYLVIHLHHRTYSHIFTRSIIVCRVLSRSRTTSPLSSEKSMSSISHTNTTEAEGTNEWINIDKNHLKNNINSKFTLAAEMYMHNRRCAFFALGYEQWILSSLASSKDIHELFNYL